MALHAILPIVLLAVLGCGARTSDAPQDVLVHVSLVALDAQNVPVVILEEESGDADAADLGRHRRGELDRRRDPPAAARAPEQPRLRGPADRGSRGRAAARGGDRDPRRDLLRDPGAADARQAGRDRRAAERRHRHRAARGRSHPRARAGFRGGGRDARAGRPPPIRRGGARRPGTRRQLGSPSSDSRREFADVAHPPARIATPPRRPRRCAGSARVAPQTREIARRDGSGFVDSGARRCQDASRAVVSLRVDSPPPKAATHPWVSQTRRAG